MALAAGAIVRCEVPPKPCHARRARLDEAVKASFDHSGGNPGTYGSPRVFEDLIEAGWKVSVNTVAASMARQGLQGRTPKRKRRGLTRPDKAAAPIPDLVKRDYNAETINHKWCGDLTEIPTAEGKLYLATVEDLASRRLPGFAIGEHHDSRLARAALCMAAATRGAGHGWVRPQPDGLLLWGISESRVLRSVKVAFWDQGSSRSGELISFRGRWRRW